MSWSMKRSHDLLVPGGHEREKRGDDERGRRQGQNDKVKRLPARTAVDAGCFFQRERDRVVVAFQLPDTEGQSGGAI